MQEISTDEKIGWAIVAVIGSFVFIAFVKTGSWGGAFYWLGMLGVSMVVGLFIKLLSKFTWEKTEAAATILEWVQQFDKRLKEIESRTGYHNSGMQRMAGEINALEHTTDQLIKFLVQESKKKKEKPAEVEKAIEETVGPWNK